MQGSIIIQQGYITGVITPSVKIVGSVASPGIISGEVCMAKPIVVLDGQDAYEGEYIVTPKTEEQVLPTLAKYMTDDITVRKIPVHKVSNASGGTTVYIGTEVI